MKTRFIVLIDFSLYSHALVELSIRWSAITDADILFVHRVASIVPGMSDEATRSGIISAEKEEAQKKLMKLTEGKVPSSAKVDYLVTEKNLLLVIEELVKEKLNNYLLMGVRGTGMLRRILMGSTANQLINELNEMTVAVPEKLCSAELCNLQPKNVIVTLSDRYLLNEKALENFLDTFKASIRQLSFISIVHEGKSDEEITSVLRSLQNRYSTRVKTSYRVFEGKGVFDAVKSHVIVDNDTVLVVQKGSRTIVDQIFRRFLIDQLVNDGSIPLVLLPGN